MADIFSTNFLAKLVELMHRPSSFLLDTYFPQVVVSDTEEINFDVVTRARRLAPLVLPVVEGQIVQEEGVTAHTIKPAYVKPKTPLTAGGALKRRPGEPIGGNMSAMDRQLARITSTIMDHIEQITRRKEWMAANALRSGSITLSGEKYPTKVVSYGRNAALTITLSGGTAWGAAGVEPLENLRSWAQLVLLHGGVGASMVTMDIDAWNLFFASTGVKEQLNFRRDVAAMFNTVLTQEEEGGVYQGSIGNMHFFVYSGWYLDDAGATQPMLPSNTVLMGGMGTEGIQAHGAIQDDSAGIMAMEYFPKSWVPEDPPIRQVMTQSAPLVVPCNVNGCLAATVA